MNSLTRRIDRIEKRLKQDNCSFSLKFPDPDSPEGFIELKGIQTITDLIAIMATKSDQKQPKAEKL